MRSDVAILALAVLVTVAAPAQAYVGPGLGLGTIGAFFGALLAGVLAFLGFFWYPIKRVIRTRKKNRAEKEAPAEHDGR